MQTDTKGATRTRRGTLIFIIGIIAFVTAGVSLFLAGKEFISVLSEAGGKLSAMNLSVIYPMAVDIVFAVLELTTGFQLIKQWKSAENIEIHKTISGLISVIVYESFALVIMSIVISLFAKDQSLRAEVGGIYILAYIFYALLISTMSTYAKKHDIMALYVVMLISSLIAVGFAGVEFIVELDDGLVLDMCFTLSHILVALLVASFSISNIVYYIRNPRQLRQDVTEGEDADVIKRTDKYEVLRVYTTRANESWVNVVITVIYVIGILVGIVGIVYFAFANNVIDWFGDDVGQTIDNIFSEVKRGDLEDILNILMVLTVLFIYSLIHISALDGVIRKKAESKISIMSVPAMGILITIFTAFGHIYSIVKGLVFDKSFSFEDLNPLDIALVVWYIVYTILSKPKNKITGQITEAIQKGDSYYSHIKGIANSVIFAGIFSVTGYVLIMLYEFSTEGIIIHYPLFIISTILIMIGCSLEVKHPFSEYEKVKRRILKETAEEQNVKEEGVEVQITEEQNA